MLANNRLTALPEEMRACQCLELVRLSDNRLTKLPDGLLIGLPKLAWVALAGNPCVTAARPGVALPPEIAISELEMKEEIGRGAGGTVHRALWRRRDGGGLDSGRGGEGDAGSVGGVEGGERAGSGGGGLGRCTAGLPVWEVEVAVKLFRASATVSDGDPAHEVEASGAVSHPNMVCDLKYTPRRSCAPPSDSGH
eukprot:scaffold3694_cov104-Isochrysis_galbana.AAC.4